MRGEGGRARAAGNARGLPGLSGGEAARRPRLSSEEEGSAVALVERARGSPGRAQRAWGSGPGRWMRPVGCGREQGPGCRPPCSAAVGHELCGRSKGKQWPNPKP